MRARTLVAAIGFVSATASAEPKPTRVDIKPFRDKMIVLQDSAGGTYIVVPGDKSGERPTRSTAAGGAEMIDKRVLRHGQGRLRANRRQRVARG
jgi:hypothetical protein